MRGEKRAVRNTMTQSQATNNDDDDHTTSISSTTYLCSLTKLA